MNPISQLRILITLYQQLQTIYFQTTIDLLDKAKIQCIIFNAFFTRQISSLHWQSSCSLVVCLCSLKKQILLKFYFRDKMIKIATNAQLPRMQILTRILLFYLPKLGNLDTLLRIFFSNFVKEFLQVSVIVSLTRKLNVLI